MNAHPARCSVGVWIDHREAVLVFVDGEQKEVVRILSDVDRHAGHPASAASPPPTESVRAPACDPHGRRFAGQLARFYEQVSSRITSAAGVLIFGPGEAKVELRRHLEKSGPAGRIVTVETADRMTDGQRVRKVRQHFKLSRPLIGARAVTAPHEQRH